MKHRSIGRDQGGLFLEVFDDETNMVGRWYAETIERLAAVNTDEVKLYPLKEEPDWISRACESQYD